MNKYLRRLILWRRLTVITVIFTIFLLAVCLKMHIALAHFKMPTKLEKLNNLNINKIVKQEIVNNSSQENDLQDNIMNLASVSNQERIQRIQDICVKYKLGNYKNINGSTNSALQFKYPPTPQYSVFYYDLEDKFAFCPLYKAASSTWLYNLCLLAGDTDESIRNTKQQLSSKARGYFPEINDVDIAKEILEKSTTLIVVRHPFERILSAYRDKLENINSGWEHGTGHFYRKFGAKIVRKYRPGGNKSVAVLKPGTYFWDKQKPKPAGIEPTFKEFVSYLLDTDLLNYADDHWIPYNLFCTPCLVKYDYVAKVETLNRDQSFIINNLGWKNRIQPRWHHKTTNNHMSSEFITKAYFSQLSIQEVQLLYEKYRLDFDMFDYSPELYLTYAKDE